MQISKKITALIEQAEHELQNQFQQIEHIAEHNQHKVLQAFWQERISARHLQGSSGYGYGDEGRDALDRVFAHALGTEDALVRMHMASGTHALAIALDALLRPGERLLCASGKPYDTLEDVIGLNGPIVGSLADRGVSCDILPLTGEGRMDLKGIERLAKNASAMHLQRSRGYAWRASLSLEQIDEAIQVARRANSTLRVLVDNCYGEFTQIHEPASADLIAGSLIKNPGGGLAATGGYIAGRADAVAMAANRLTCAGLGREVGSYAPGYTSLYQGLYFAPHVVAQSLKSATLAAQVMQHLGYAVMPQPMDSRDDIVQSIQLGTPQRVLAFCQGIQQAAPIDSGATPMPWDMPGYRHPVVMAAGAFIQGSSIELSADAPMCEPYIVYYQGGLTYVHGKIGLMMALEQMDNQGLLEVDRIP